MVVGRNTYPCLDSLKEARQTRFQPPCHPFDIHQGDIAHTALDATVVGPVQPASLRCFLLIDALFLADAANGTAKSDANIDGHSLR